MRFILLFLLSIVVASQATAQSLPTLSSCAEVQSRYSSLGAGFPAATVRKCEDNFISPHEIHRGYRFVLAIVNFRMPFGEAHLYNNPDNPYYRWRHGDLRFYSNENIADAADCSGDWYRGVTCRQWPGEGWNTFSIDEGAFTNNPVYVRESLLFFAVPVGTPTPTPTATPVPTCISDEDRDREIKEAIDGHTNLFCSVNNQGLIEQITDIEKNACNKSPEPNLLDGIRAVQLSSPQTLTTAPLCEQFVEKIIFSGRYKLSGSAGSATTYANHLVNNGWKCSDVTKFHPAKLGLGSFNPEAVIVQGASANHVARVYAVERALDISPGEGLKSPVQLYNEVQSGVLKYEDYAKYLQKIKRQNVRFLAYGLFDTGNGFVPASQELTIDNPKETQICIPPKKSAQEDLACEQPLADICANDIVKELGFQSSWVRHLTPARKKIACIVGNETLRHIQKHAWLEPYKKTILRAAITKAYNESTLSNERCKLEEGKYWSCGVNQLGDEVLKSGENRKILEKNTKLNQERVFTARYQNLTALTEHGLSKYISKTPYKRGEGWRAYMRWLSDNGASGATTKQIAEYWAVFTNPNSVNKNGKFHLWTNYQLMYCE